MNTLPDDPRLRSCTSLRAPADEELHGDLGPELAAPLPDAGALLRSEAASVAEALRLHAPGDRAIGFTHKELCAQDRVRDESARAVGVSGKELVLLDHEAPRT